MATFAISWPVGKRISREHFFESMRLILIAFILLMLIGPVYGQQNELDEMNKKGLSLGEQGKYDEAIQIYDAIIKIDPDNLRGWINKGAYLEKQGKYNESLVCINEGIRLAPNDPFIDTAWQQKTRFLRDHGNYTDAIKAYNESIRLNPDSIGRQSPTSELSTIINWGESNGPLGSYIAATSEDPDSFDNWLDAGYALCFHERFEDAIKCFDEAIKLDPDSVDAWYSKGYALDYLGHKTAARTALITADMLWYRQQMEMRREGPGATY
jgi:tetratricopeptide (TPR) repeat protein